MNVHPDLDALSASLDGEDEAARAHAGACEACAAQVAALAAARDAVAAPVPPLAADRHEAALAAALAEFDAGHAGAAEPARAAREASPGRDGAMAPIVALVLRRWQWVAGSAVAAVLVLVVGMATLFGQGGTDGDVSTALRAPEAESGRAGGATGIAGDAGTATGGPSATPPAVREGGDLGEVAGADALRSRYAALTNQSQASARANSAGPTSAAGSTGPSPVQVGTRACEIEARAARPSVGVVTYQATATFGGTRAVVLGFGPTAGSPPTVLLALAEQGCRLLGEATLP